MPENSVKQLGTAMNRSPCETQLFLTPTALSHSPSEAEIPSADELPLPRQLYVAR